jgi:predicted nucleic acid-binding protein
MEAQAMTATLRDVFADTTFWIALVVKVMEDAGLTDALTADEHFRQAGFRTVLLDEP